MKDWISYLEKYRCNKALLELRLAELKNYGEQADDADSARKAAGVLCDGVPEAREEMRKRLEEVTKSLEKEVKEAEDKFERYIPDDADPRETMKFADEKLFLSYRYICGMTMLETAFAMCVSKDTVYRIRRRVLTRNPPE